MVRTRSRKARDTQWTRDAVLNNPDLLCHIAEQADLPTACKLLTTSKRNFIGCHDFFKKQYDYYNKQYNFFWNKQDCLWAEYAALNLTKNLWAPLSVERSILYNEREQVWDEYRAASRSHIVHCSPYGPVTRRYKHLL